MRISEESHPDTGLLIRALESGDFYTFAHNMKNVLEFPAFELEPQIKQLKRQISDTGAVGSLMSGSGSTVFGLYDSKETALRAMNSVTNAALQSRSISRSPFKSFKNAVRCQIKSDKNICY